MVPRIRVGRSRRGIKSNTIRDTSQAPGEYIPAARSRRNSCRTAAKFDSAERDEKARSEPRKKREPIRDWKPPMVRFVW